MAHLGSLIIVFAAAQTLATDVISDGLLAELSRKELSWTAGSNPRFHALPLRQAKEMLTLTAMSHRLPPHPEPPTFRHLPDSFDSSKAWSNCSSIGTVQDQGACASDWAVSASEVVSDRLCIASNGSITTPVSAQMVISCCFFCGRGCAGGNPTYAWQYMKSDGVASVYTYPYAIAPCEHHVNSTERPPCGDIVQTPSCNTSETGGDRVFVDQFYSVGNGLDGDKKIQEEIYANGPVQATMNVYQDFFAYRNGTYSHATGVFLGYQSVKLIGWGVEDTANGKSEKYWLAMNSWNTDWGLRGLFKIRRGHNECGIEDSVLAGSIRQPAPPEMLADRE